ncbi:MAG: tRNA (adenosine(37)-N6)-threonylcarbamoyltransferase complex ATPase subunit type 1 TsaE [Actinomycetota bacterium]|nr:tRNA (adenosine(37)-N6)-threonylcarbamoyltransferase complex ATPase subunit type 1 TsaE [Actinomycetota bacterium]
MAWTLRARASSPEETRELAARLARAARRGDVVILEGALGAGKTTFAQGFARGVGVEGPVTSPTFTLVRQYPSALGELVHVDVYRLEHLAEVADLGLSELVEDGVALVEWGDAARPALGEVAWTVTIARTEEGGEDDRIVSISGDDDARRDEFAVTLSAGASQRPREGRPA